MMPILWKDVSPELKKEFLMGDKIKLEDWYVDNINAPITKYTVKDIDTFCSKIRNKEIGFSYGITDTWLYEALEIIPINQHNVAIMGSLNPWYESTTLVYGGLPTIIEYNLPNYNHPLIKEILISDTKELTSHFDSAISISSFEHDGLGRYGDPLDPNADIKAMQSMKKLLKPNGILFLAVPIGIDKLVWNAHRIYGNIRLKLLLENWEVVGSIGYDESNLFTDTGVGATYQPIIVLKNT